MRTLRYPLMAACVVALIGGCGKPDGPATPSKPADKPQPVVGAPTVPTAAGEDLKASAITAATVFLKTVQEGKATSASLAPAFKKVIAPAELDADKAAGYSESGVREWLARLKWEGGSIAVAINHATADFAIAKTPYSQGEKDGSANIYIWLVRQESQWLVGEMLIDHVFGKFDIPDGEAAATTFAVRSFADGLIQKNLPKLESRMTKALKAKLAPPRFPADDAQGYSSSALKTAFAELSAGRVAVPKVELKGNAATLEVFAGDARKTIDVKLVPGATPGEFLIDDLQQK